MKRSPVTRDRLGGTFDGDGQLLRWNLYGTGLVGRIEPEQPSAPSASAAAEDAQTSLTSEAQAATLRLLDGVGIAEADTVWTLIGADLLALSLSKVEPALDSASVYGQAMVPDKVGDAYFDLVAKQVYVLIRSALIDIGYNEERATEMGGDAARCFRNTHMDVLVLGTC
jgi:hypothetical protein